MKNAIIIREVSSNDFPVEALRLSQMKHDFWQMTQKMFSNFFVKYSLISHTYGPMGLIKIRKNRQMLDPKAHASQDNHLHT